MGWVVCVVGVGSFFLSSGLVVLREDRDGPEARVGGGSSGRFEVFHRDNYGPVVGLAYVLSGSWPQAEEIAQEAFLRALARWDGGLSRPEGWFGRWR